MLTLVSEAEVRALRSAPFTYDDVGATGGSLPSGFQHLRYGTLPGHPESGEESHVTDRYLRAVRFRGAVPLGAGSWH